MTSLNLKLPLIKINKKKKKTNLNEFELIKLAVKRTIHSNHNSNNSNNNNSNNSNNRKINEFGQLQNKTDESDLCHDNWEIWAEKHGKKIQTKYTTNDIRQLRKWFLNLDKDQSGEVGFDELFDPLLSAGILKTKEDVELLIRNADSDGSGEIGFEEFLNALHKNKICNKEQIKILQDITNKSTNEGLSTEMKLSQERRKHLLITVIDETRQRQHEVDQVYSFIEKEDHKNLLKNQNQNNNNKNDEHKKKKKTKKNKLNKQNETNEKINKEISDNHDKQDNYDDEEFEDFEEFEEEEDNNSKNNHKNHNNNNNNNNNHNNNHEHKKKHGKNHHHEIDKLVHKHHKQLYQSYNYLDSMNAIIKEQKNSVPEFSMKVKDVYRINYPILVEDPMLDIGYKDGFHGRKESIKRLKYIDEVKLNEYRILKDQQNNSEDDDDDDDIKYQLQYTNYRPIEIDLSHGKHKKHHLNKKNLEPLNIHNINEPLRTQRSFESQHSHRSLEPLRTQRSLQHQNSQSGLHSARHQHQLQHQNSHSSEDTHQPLHTFRSQNSFPKLQTSQSEKVVLKKQPSENTKSLLKFKQNSFQNLNRQNSVPSTGRLTERNEVVNYQPKKKISIVRRFPKNITLI